MKYIIVIKIIIIIYFGYLSANLTMFILNIIVLWFIPNCSTRFLNFALSLNFLKYLPCSYA